MYNPCPILIASHLPEIYQQNGQHLQFLVLVNVLMIGRKQVRAPLWQ